MRRGGEAFVFDFLFESNKKLNQKSFESSGEFWRAEFCFFFFLFESNKVSYII